MQTDTSEAQRQHQARFQRGLEQFNAGEFFEAHETWEEIWLNSAEPQKTFLQGVIQIAAAFHHYGRGNLQGTRSLLKAGLRRLTPFPPTYHGIAVEQLRVVAQQWTVDLAADRDPGLPRVPQIHLV